MMRLFRIPLMLALLMLAGLLLALTGDGWRNWVAWIALALPLAIVARAVVNRSR